ncbi:catalase, partial [Staphylococcus aureus]
APTNIIPGLDFSPDKMLQGRLFSYGDAQRYRLGVNHWQIPVNQPKGVGIENICPFSRDGQMRVLDNNQGGGTHYYPNNQGKFDSQPEYKKP